MDLLAKNYIRKSLSPFLPSGIKFNIVNLLDMVPTLEVERKTGSNAFTYQDDYFIIEIMEDRIYWSCCLVFFNPTKSESNNVSTVIGSVSTKEAAIELISKYYTRYYIQYILNLKQ